MMAWTQPMRVLRSLSPRSRFHQGRPGAALMVQVSLGGRDEAETAVLQDTLLEVSVWHRAAAGGGGLERHVLGVLCRRLGVPHSQVEIVARRAGKRWLVVFYDLSPAELERRVQRWQGHPG